MDYFAHVLLPILLILPMFVPQEVSDAPLLVYFPSHLNLFKY